MNRILTSNNTRPTIMILQFSYYIQHQQCVQIKPRGAKKNLNKAYTVSSENWKTKTKTKQKKRQNKCVLYDRYSRRSAGWIVQCWQGPWPQMTNSPLVPALTLLYSVVSKERYLRKILWKWLLIELVVRPLWTYILKNILSEIFVYP